MPISRCPGQDNRYWSSDDVIESPCPSCGKTIEFWKQEPRRRCIHCGRSVLNPNLDLGCAKWCKQAADCLGIPVSDAAKQPLAETMIREMKQLFGGDQKRISAALVVLDYAETLLASCQADPLVVKAAAIFHDVGESGKWNRHRFQTTKFESVPFSDPVFVPISALGAVREILARLSVDNVRADLICDLIEGLHGADELDAPEFHVLWDACELAEIPRACADKSPEQLREWLEWGFRTDAGKAMAHTRLAKRL
jgi:hypothetical protein